MPFRPWRARRSKCAMVVEPTISFSVPTTKATTFSLAPGVFVGGGAHPVTVTYGQFASMLLEPVARLSLAGSLNKSFATHRCSDSSLGRLWSTALEIRGWPVAGRPAVLRWAAWRVPRSAERPSRSRYVPQLLRFEITDADLEPVTADSTCALSHRPKWPSPP